MTPLTYLWEQTDAGGLTGTGLVDNTKRDGPLFRQFGVAANVSADRHAALPLAGREPRRHLAEPDLPGPGPDPGRQHQRQDRHLPGRAGRRPLGRRDQRPAATVDCYSEFLPTGDWVGNPTSARVLHFRLTARDEFTPDAAADHAGGLSSANVALTVTPSAGPFLVTSQATSGPASGVETVRWDVAGTNTAALAQNVRISLSTDGGQTFPTVLVGDHAQRRVPDGAAAATSPPPPRGSRSRRSATTSSTSTTPTSPSASRPTGGHRAGQAAGSPAPGGRARSTRRRGKATFEFLGGVRPRPERQRVLQVQEGQGRLHRRHRSRTSRDHGAQAQD